jgi:hypothetical protein
LIRDNCLFWARQSCTQRLVVDTAGGSVTNLGKHDVGEAGGGALPIPVTLKLAGEMDPADGDAAGLGDALHAGAMGFR